MKLTWFTFVIGDRQHQEKQSRDVSKRTESFCRYHFDCDVTDFGVPVRVGVVLPRGRDGE